MFDRNSDYALNKKNPDAIVCKSAAGIHIRLARAKIYTRIDYPGGSECIQRQKQVLCKYAEKVG